jgi:hypothetical protein
VLKPLGEGNVSAAIILKLLLGRAEDRYTLTDVR